MKGDLEQVADGMALAGGDDVVLGFVLLQHEPHRPNVVAGEAPVPGHVHVADRQDLLAAKRDPRDGARHLAGEELKSPAR